MLLLCLCCFFFFKQKTAYEMRISDWSSDVCSSDLFPAATGTRVERRRRRLARRAQLHLDTATARRRRVARQPVEVAQDDEIGRASCRERVCQYGVDLGGRRNIKKKKRKEKYKTRKKR